MTTLDTRPAAAAGTILIGDRAVHRMGYGAMRITGKGIWGPPADREQAKRVLRRAIALGVNFIDTADAYGPEVSEELIAEALHPYPADLVIATKGGLVRTGPNQWWPIGRPEYLRTACENSLRRLKVDCIDLYQYHRPDPTVPYAESIGAFARLREEGKIRHVGISNATVEMLTIAREIVPVVSVQNRYNLTDRGSEDVLRVCERDGIAFLPWFPLAAGQHARAGSPLIQAAKQHNATPAQISLAWLLWRSPVMLPIPGTSSVEHLEENIAAAALRLSDAEFSAIGPR